MKVVSEDLLPLFARHETFHPRIGWLTKAVDAAERDPYAFSSERAPIELGVGKNMVRAIRYWGLATKVLKEGEPRPESRTTPVFETQLGALLLGRNGLDRFIEDPRTLWILHWHLLQAPVYAPVWWWAFNFSNAGEFEAADLVQLASDAMLQAGWTGIASSSIEKDVDCLLRMYGRRSSPEDWLDSPFSMLELIEPLPRSRRWRWGYPARSIEPSIVMYAALDSLRVWEPAARTVSFARLAAAPGGPGRAFRLSEADLAQALIEIAERTDGLTVATPAGLRQLIASREPEVLQAEMLARAYGQTFPGQEIDVAVNGPEHSRVA